MSRVPAVTIAVLALAFVPFVAAQERFLFDKLQYTAGSAYGPVNFSESQFPLNSAINGRSATALNAVPLPAKLKFTFTYYDAPSSDAIVTNAWALFFLANLDGEVVEGTTAGILGIDFGTNVTAVSFGFALATLDSLNPGCTVTAYDSSGNVVGTSTSAAEQQFTLSEGQAAFASASGFRRIEVKFASSFPERIPALGGTGLALLGLLLGAAGALALRRGLA
jgi:hypothetical protein